MKPGMLTSKIKTSLFSEKKKMAQRWPLAPPTCSHLSLITDRTTTTSVSTLMSTVLICNATSLPYVWCTAVNRNSTSRFSMKLKKTTYEIAKTFANTTTRTYARIGTTTCNIMNQKKNRHVEFSKTNQVRRSQ